jgi:hypothetical protein
MSLPPPPVPSRSPLASFFPTAKTKLYVPLPPDEVHRRLLGPHEQEWQIGEGGMLGNSRRYKVRSRPDGRMLDIAGPYGYRKLRLSTEATIQAAGEGTSLELESWISSLYVLILLGSLVWVAIGPRLLRFPFTVPLPLVLLVAIVFYVITMFQMKYEARLLRDYCARRLGDEWNRVRF